MSQHRSSPSVFAAEIPRLLRFIGRPELARELGLGGERLDDPDASVPIDVWYDVVEAAIEASGDPFLGLHFGTQSLLDYRPSAGAMGLLILASDTVRVALDRTWRYQRFWNGAERYDLETDGELVIRYSAWGPSRPAHVQLAEKTAAQSVRFIRGAARGHLPLAVRFPHPRRMGSEELARVLGCEPSFDHTSTEIVFDPVVLEAKLASGDSVLFRVLDRHLAQRVLGVTPESAIADRVRKAISDYLHREELSIDLVANVLNMSDRTLQRRLRDERTSFRDLMDEIRRSRALALIDSGATVDELVLVLGYVEEATFYRAFRRWTGATPETWRSRGMRAGSSC